jgi:hypothetical protein
VTHHAIEQRQSVDLAALAASLDRSFGGSLPEGYVRGRTALRDAVAAQLHCPDAMAEQVVETMIGRSFLRFDGDPTSPADAARPWVISVPA